MIFIARTWKMHENLDEQLAKSYPGNAVLTLGHATGIAVSCEDAAGRQHVCWQREFPEAAHETGEGGCSSLGGPSFRYTSDLHRMSEYHLDAQHVQNMCKTRYVGTSWNFYHSYSLVIL